MIADEIEAYYRELRELERLTSGIGKLEFLRTWDIMARELPAAPASVLDVGGATGVYAAPLARAGYQVHVVDPVPEQIAVAAALPGVTASVGDARALSQPDAGFDAVLLFGPLYHLSERSDRVRAWAEARRVVRPGGVVLGATISRFTSFFDGISREFVLNPTFRDIVDRDQVDGRHDNPDNVPGWFTTAYFQHTDEIPGEVADAGLAMRRMVSVETAAAFSRGGITSMADNPDVVEWMLDVMRRIEDEPTLLGASPHVLTIARA